MARGASTYSQLLRAIPPTDGDCSIPPKDGDCSIPPKRWGLFHPTNRWGLFHPTKRWGLFHPTKRWGLFHPTKRWGLFHDEHKNVIASAAVCASCNDIFVIPPHRRIHGQRQRRKPQDHARSAMKTQDYIELENQYNAHNYHPLDVVIEKARGRVGHRCGRQEVSGLPVGVFGGEPGPQSSAHRAGDEGSTRSGGADLARVPQQSTAAAGEGTVRTDRLRDDAAHELRRGSGGDGHQGGAQVGLHGQGRARWAGGDHRVPR